MKNMTRTEVEKADVEPRMKFVTIGPDIHRRIDGILKEMAGEEGFRQIPYGWEIYQADRKATGVMIPTHGFMTPDGSGMRSMTDDEMREFVRTEISNYVPTPAPVASAGMPKGGGDDAAAAPVDDQPEDREISEGIRFLLSDDFEMILRNAHVSPMHAIADDDEVVADWLGCPPIGDPMFPAVAGYDLVEADGERPLMLLRYKKRPIGFYVDMSLYIRPKHRNLGYGPSMILASAIRFGTEAFINDMADPRSGIGFTEAEYGAHALARRTAARIAAGKK